jgi:hypothetical protein
MIAPAPGDIIRGTVATSKTRAHEAISHKGITINTHRNVAFITPAERRHAKPAETQCFRVEVP